MVTESMKVEDYHVFTYRFYPISEPIQQELDRVNTSDTVFARRNEIFINTLKSSINPIVPLRVSRPTCELRFLESRDSVMMFQINKRSKGHKSNKDFTVESFEHFPFVHLIIATGDDEQAILVEKAYPFASDPRLAIKVIVGHANQHLRSFGLEMSFDQMLSTTDFWKVVDGYPEGISQVKFTIPPANLARSNRDTYDSIQRLESHLKAKDAKLILRASESNELKLEQSDPMLSALVENTKNGVEPPSIKPRNTKGWIKTGGMAKLFRLRRGELNSLFPPDLKQQIHETLRRDDSNDNDTPLE